MGRTHGYRAGTRRLFKREFRKNGAPNLSTYLEVYKVGDIVDIKANSSIHKGMPHKFYHGKTGVIYNVTRRAVGVVVNKRVRTRIVRKHVILRIEHIKHSNCQKEFIALKKERDRLEAEAKITNVKVNLKRIPKQPREGHVVSTEGNLPELVYALPYAGLE